MRHGIAALGMLLATTSMSLADNAQIYREMLSPVVQVNRTCSGTIVRSYLTEDGKVSNYILTAKHCIENSATTQQIYVPVYRNNKLIKEELYLGSVASMYGKHDIALIKLLDDEVIFSNIVNLAAVDAPLYEGEPVWVSGWPMGESRTLTTGYFSNRISMAFPNPMVESEYFKTTAVVTGGNSGGALFHKNEATGVYEMIGVTSSRKKAENFMTYFVPIDVIHDALKSMK